MDRLLEYLRNLPWKPKFNFPHESQSFLRKWRNVIKDRKQIDRESEGTLVNSSSFSECLKVSSSSTLTLATLSDDFVDLKSICQTLRDRRFEILSVLLNFGILTPEEFDSIHLYPRSMTKNTFHNYLWFPDHLLFGTCFADFVNYRLEDGATLKKLLESPVKEKSQRDSEKDLLIGDLLDEHDGKFYSFCLGRVVSLTDSLHCAQCHSCKGRSYWHCKQCNRCSLGMNIGVCEHCGFRDLHSSDEEFSRRFEDDVSVVSVSELLNVRSRQDVTEGLF